MEKILTKNRIMEYASMDGLVKMTGVEPEMFDLYILKELSDNSLDACETYGIRPKLDIQVEVSGNFLYLTVSDNGPGIPKEMIGEMTDFSRFSGTKYYVKKPTRGAQGNALMTILALPCILSYVAGRTTAEAVTITTKNQAYSIRIFVDKVMQKIEPRIETVKLKSTRNDVGTSIELRLPLDIDYARKKDGPDYDNVDIKEKWGSWERYYDLLEGLNLWNPHAEFHLSYKNDKEPIIKDFEASMPECKKFAHKGLGSVHWYKEPDFIELVHANIRANKEKGCKETIINFAKRFKGCTGNSNSLTKNLTKGLSGKYVDDLITDKQAKVLFNNLKKVSRSLSVSVLGEIGKEHLHNVINRYEILDESLFNYAKMASEDNGIPYVLEVAFSVVKKLEKRRVQFGINQTVTYTLPFEEESFKADLDEKDNLSAWGACGIDGLLRNLHVTEGDPVFVAIHLTTPNIRYRDYGKSKIELSPD